MGNISLGASASLPKGFSAVGAGHYLRASDHTVWALQKAADGTYALVRLREEPAVDLRRAAAVPARTAQDDFERQQIIDAMARALFVSAWADAESSVGRNHGGMDAMDVAPETDEAAEAAATRLATQIEQANGGKALPALLADAYQADGHQGGAPVGYAEDFGHNLGMMALGTGVGWFDDHAKFPLKVPHTEFYLDPVEADQGAEGTLLGNEPEPIQASAAKRTAATPHDNSEMVPWPPEYIDISPMQFWWDGQGDILYYLYSTPDAEVSASDVEQAIDQIETDLGRQMPDDANDSTLAMIDDLREYLRKHSGAAKRTAAENEYRTVLEPDEGTRAHPSGWGADYAKATIDQFPPRDEKELQLRLRDQRQRHLDRAKAKPPSREAAPDEDEDSFMQQNKVAPPRQADAPSGDFDHEPDSEESTPLADNQQEHPEEFQEWPINMEHDDVGLCASRQGQSWESEQERERSEAPDANYNYETGGRNDELPGHDELESLVEFMYDLGLSSEEQEREIKRYKLGMPPIDSRLGYREATAAFQPGDRVRFPRRGQMHDAIVLLLKPDQGTADLEDVDSGEQHDDVPTEIMEPCGCQHGDAGRGIPLLPWEAAGDDDADQGRQAQNDADWDAGESELGQPEEGDYVITPTGPLGSLIALSQVGGKFLGKFRSTEEAQAAAEKHMQGSNVIGSIWWQDDHGGLERIARRRVAHPFG